MAAGAGEGSAREFTLGSVRHGTQCVQQLNQHPVQYHEYAYKQAKRTVMWCLGYQRKHVNICVYKF